MRRHLSWYGWVGLVGMGLAEVGLFLRVEPLTTWFTPLIWTLYILFIDSLVRLRSGRSLLSQRFPEAVAMFVFSDLGWLVFEVYNLRLRNWYYVGVPAQEVWRTASFFWSFGTIFPALFVTQDLLESFNLFETTRPKVTVQPGILGAASIVGLACLTIPPLLSPPLIPVDLAPYLFGFVWLGFIFLLEPIHYHWGLPSLVAEWEQGRRGRTYRLLLGGLICGFLWEFWNYWAGAKWHYLAPILRNVRLFEMPVLGFLGFPPFALECWLLYHFLRAAVFGKTGSDLQRGKASAARQGG
jgi:hypothetical protein